MYELESLSCDTISVFLYVKLTYYIFRKLYEYINLNGEILIYYDTNLLI